MRTFMRKKTFQALKGRIFPTIVGDRSKNSAHVVDSRLAGLEWRWARLLRCAMKSRDGVWLLDAECCKQYMLDTCKPTDIEVKPVT
jgi:hypothetical protein